MSTIIGISGSHRSDSNANRLLGYALEKLSDKHTTELVSLLDIDIACRGCDACFADYAFHKDALALVHERMLKADAFVISSPTYFGMPSGLTKTLMDRTNSIWLAKLFKGKIGAAIVSGASRFGAIEMNAKNILHFFHDHEMICVPFYACFNSAIKHDHERFPEPLAMAFTEPLDKLVAEIDALLSRSTPSPKS